jgi:hypothetical protein
VKDIEFSDHALLQMRERGAIKGEVAETLRSGEKLPAKSGRYAYRKNFQYNAIWGEKFYRIKQVMVIVKEENHKIIIITVFTFYF